MKKMEMEMKKIEFEKKKQLAEVKRKSKLKADLRKLDTEFSDKSSRRSGSTITRSNSLPFADDRSHISSWLDSLNGYDEQMITDQNDISEDKFNEMSRDMQRELATVDEDANLPNYGRSRQFLNQDSSRERSVKLSQKNTPVCQNEILFDRSLGQMKQQAPQILTGGSRDIPLPR